MKFNEFDFSDDMLDALEAMHFEDCTPIQELAIPKALEGRDLIACAQTGTGKTAAYLLPVISMIDDYRLPSDAINCVIMVPTRELAQQIDQQLQGFSYYVPVSGVAIYGGTDGPVFAQQQRALKEGADIVIATPGRLLAHMQMGYVDLSEVSFFVLDEADRMLDMGFYDDIMQIAAQLPPDRQTLMFSATMPPKIQQMAKKILTEPAEVKLAVSKPGSNIHQSAFVCYETQKLALLKHLFRTVHSKRVIVFSSSKIKVKELSRALRQSHYAVAEMHSDLDQNVREDVMLAFRAGRTDILVATDIVARGIDIDDISMVVNYDVPHEAEDYVHRIGRTARAGADGKAVTFVSEREQGKFKMIEDFLEKEVPKETLPGELGDAPEYKPGRGGNRGGDGRRRHGQRGGGQPHRSKNRQNTVNGPSADRKPDPSSRRRGSNRNGHGNRKKKAGGNRPEGQNNGQLQ
ncbi:MAG: DEAD/DEAH box helicase [Muribaculaceae bacterium]|nr:DEAD/DEAH box helicase [Muribaculaceae bacterium]